MQDIVIQNVADKDLLVYEGNKWVNKTVEEIFANYINTLSSTIISIEKIDNNTHQALIDNEFAEKDPKANDIVIIKELINGDKYQHTGYVFNGENWTALDGNYNANNIYFDKDFIFTEDIGTVSIPEGQGNIVVDAKGKNLKEFLSTLFAEEKNPEITNPSATITLGSTTTNCEVGEIYSPSYTVTFNSGKYSYGPNYTNV